ncbi:MULTISPECIES: hypothetical protein [Anaeromyxobacter]|uniref:hypothetical protein n=1 Tax=Anaeromyxobacter TaxID=161492 RepID=UPI001F5AB2BB|nr:MULTISPECIES: hypothetical protein [unclassified Anaeromyxobacter]
MSVMQQCGPGLWCDELKNSCVRQSPGAAGAPCDGASPECDVGLYCDAGVCREKLAAGGDCTDTLSACARGTTCLVATNSSLWCVPYAGLGEACDPRWSWPWCARGTYCDGTTARCEADKLPGGSCADSDECLKGYCDYATARCVALKAAGTPCTAHRECASGLCDSASLVCNDWLTFCAP